MKHICTICLSSLIIMISVFLTNCKNSAVDPAAQVKSHTFTVTAWNWSPPHHYVNLAVPEITSSNIETAGVMVYYSTQPNTWTSVPYTVYGTVHNYYMGFRYTPGLVEVTWLYDGLGSGDDPNTYYNTNVKCKVVIVPSSARKANPDINWDNYEDVRQRFGLNE